MSVSIECKMRRDTLCAAQPFNVLVVEPDQTLLCLRILLEAQEHRHMGGLCVALPPPLGPHQLDLPARPHTIVL